MELMFGRLIQMPRRTMGYRLDLRCIEAINKMAERTGRSSNGYLEFLIFEHAKLCGILPPDAQPLDETRGRPRGKRKSGESAEQSVVENEPVEQPDEKTASVEDEPNESEVRDDPPPPTEESN